MPTAYEAASAREGGSIAASTTGALDLVWGAENIARAIGRTERQTKHMLATGALPAAKVGGRWVVSLSGLAAHFSQQASKLVTNVEVQRR